VRMSRTRGTRCKVTASSVNSPAASAGSAEFFEPLAGISPRSATPPVITNLSIIYPAKSILGTLSSLANSAQRLPDASTRCGQTPLRLFPRDAGLTHHDRGPYAHPALRQQFDGALRR